VRPYSRKMSVSRASAIVRIKGVSESWLQYYVNQKYDQTPKQVQVSKKKRVCNSEESLRMQDALKTRQADDSDR
jgi:hypothetical protein